MKILAISDVESPFLWDYYKPGRLNGIDLIISCGDLNPQYLSFLETFSNVPLLYVHGNHDEKYKTVPPDGCFCTDVRFPIGAKLYWQSSGAPLIKCPLYTQCQFLAPVQSKNIYL